jgi:putative intracellular protease/amidase
MTTPTSIEVSVDAAEYSKYEEGRDTITVTLSITGGAPYVDEQIFVDLVKARRSRDAVVATSTLSFTNTTDPQSAVVEFFIPEIVDQDLISLVRHGKYFVKATSVVDEDITASTDDFDISIVSVARLKSDYLFGLDLTATQIREPKFQPQEIDVTIEEMSDTHPLGAFNLGYVYHEDPTANATAVVGTGGTNGEVTITSDGTYLGADGNALTVTVQTPTGTSPLSASFAANQLIINLDVDGDVLDDLENTATLVAAAIDALPDFSAVVAPGDGSVALDTAEGPTQFAGGLTTIVRQMNWHGGPLVSITTSGVVILLAGDGGTSSTSCAGTGGVIPGTTSDFVCVRVKSILLLPEDDVTETILIDKKTMDDASIRRYLCQAVAWVEKDFLATYVEPTNVVTDRDPTTIQYSAGINAPAPIFTDTDFDYIVSPLTYFVPRSQGKWVQIQTPFPQLLRVDSLFGAIANTRVIDIDLEWIEHSEQGGMIQLVPFNQEIAFDFIGLLWVNAIRGAAELPNFWHYNAIVGTREASCDIQELIAKKAAIDALVMAGQAIRPGLGSTSLSRDGVSESVSYINSATYGMFTGTINSYKDWITEHGKELRAKYRGVTMVIV